MRNLLRIIARHHFFFLFLLLETFSFFLIVQKNSFQRAGFVSITRTIDGYFNEKFGGFREYMSLKEFNDNIFRENILLRNQIDALERQLLNTNLSSKDSLELRQFSYIPSRVINNSTNKQFNFISLDKGYRHGIENEMGVISPTGVVGIIYGVSANYSTVIPVINRNFKLSSKIKKSGYYGSLSWPGDDYLYAHLSEIPYHVEIAEGDTIVTSGYSAIFPEGIHIGTIEEFSVEEGNFYEIKVRLGVNFKNLSYVTVIQNMLREDQLELEKLSGDD